MHKAAGNKTLIIQSRANQISYAGASIQYLPDTIIMGGLFITGSKTASNETGIPGMGDEVVIIGHATDTTVLGNSGTKKEPGGISPGTILHDLVN